MDWGEILFFFAIIIAKVIEVSFGTLRIVMIAKGERKIGAILAFIEIIIWLVLVGSILTNITEYPLRALAYAVGFALGNYLGSYIEEKLAIGLSEVKVIVIEKDSPKVVSALRNSGFAVTQIKAQGKTDPRELLVMYIPRAKIRGCVATIRGVEENAVITISDTKPLLGGFGLIRK